jgi:2-pyrone-4,6-dicarboxylate lactonase
MTADCAGPDPHPHAAVHPAPPGAVDSHAHIFGPLSRFPYVMPRSYTPPEAPLAAYLAMLDAIGVEHGVLVQPSVYGTDNGCLLDGLAQAKGRLRGVVVADPRALDPRTIEEWTGLGVCGMRLNMAVPGGLPLQEMEAMGACLAEIGWHLDLIVDNAERMADVAPRLAKLKAVVCVEQMGRVKGGQPVAAPGFQALLALLREGKDYVKLSHAYHISTAGAPYADTTPFARALVEAAPERLVWGSDWPHPIVHGAMPNDGDLLDLLAEWVPQAAARHRILADNARRLYGFAAPR